MSNFDSDNKKNIISNTAVPDLKKTKWQSIQTDLNSALSEWAAYENVEIQKTPEEIQLDKVKSMIENIKEKLNQF